VKEYEVCRQRVASEVSRCLREQDLATMTGGHKSGKPIKGWGEVVTVLGFGLPHVQRHMHP